MEQGETREDDGRIETLGELKLADQSKLKRSEAYMASKRIHHERQNGRQRGYRESDGLICSLDDQDIADPLQFFVPNVRDTYLRYRVSGRRNAYMSGSRSRNGTS